MASMLPFMRAHSHVLDTSLNREPWELSETYYNAIKIAI